MRIEKGIQVNMKISVEVIKYLSKIKNSIYEDLKIEFLYHSNKLEGSTFDRNNIAQLINQKKVSGEHFLDDIVETNNSIDLFDLVIQGLNQELDKYMLWEWHRTLKKGSVDEEIQNTGCWKKYSNRLLNIDIDLCEPRLVDNAIFNLLEDWKQSNKDINEIVKFHYKFEKIHPFQDGNGRIGRFIILKQCIENNIDLIAIDNEYNTEYRQALYEAQKKDNIFPLIEVFKKSQIRLNNKLKQYEEMIEQVKKDVNIED